MSHTHDHALHDCSASGHSHDLPPRTNAQLEADRAEKAATDLVLASFYHYQSNTLAANQRRLKDVLSLKKEDQDLLAKLGYREKLKKVDELIVQNADLLREIADTVGHDMFGEDESDSEDEEGEEKEAPAAVARHPYDDDDDDDEDLEEYYDDLDSSSPGPPNHHSHSHDSPSHSHSHDPPSHSHVSPEAKEDSPKSSLPKPTEHEMDKIRSTLKQFVRDWSREGKVERDAVYQPMLDALAVHYKDVPKDERAALTVLTPGAGLARLSWEICQEGYSSQGSEFSYYMLLGSFFMLNRTSTPLSHPIYPFLHSFSNHSTNASMMREILIPDVDPSSLPEGSNFSLIAGDFLEVYGAGDEDEQWDAVLTSFFIDTSKNIVEYLRVLYRILKPGGIWVNCGPLLWHFENSKEVSIELSMEEVKFLCAEIGFDIHNEKTIRSTYTGNAQGLLRHEYQAEFWTATKKKED